MQYYFHYLIVFKLRIFCNNLNLITGDFSFAIVLTLSTADNNFSLFIFKIFLLSFGITLL